MNSIQRLEKCISDLTLLQIEMSGRIENAKLVTPEFGGIPIAAVTDHQDRLKNRLKTIWVQLQVAINIDRPDLIDKEMENLKKEIEAI